MTDRDPSSYIDPHGFLFHLDGRILRYLYPESASLYERMLKNGVLTKLQDKNLVETWRTDFQLEGLPGPVVEHRTVKPLTYCVEWCPSMLLDAANVTLELTIEALAHSLTLQDAYPWNVLFEGTRPVFVDLTSLVKLDPTMLWAAQGQFDAFFHYPLVLSAHGRGSIARSLLYNNIIGIPLETFYHLTPFRYRVGHPSVVLAAWINKKLQRSVAAKRRIRNFSEKVSGNITDGVRARFLPRTS